MRCSIINSLLAIRCFILFLTRFTYSERKWTNWRYNRNYHRAVQKRWNDVLSIEKVIREKTDVENPYLVFIDIEFDLDWIIKEMPQGSESHVARVMAIETQPNEYLPIKQRLAFKTILGEAIVTAMEENYNESDLLMQRALLYLQARTEECSRRWMFLYSTLDMLLVSFLVSCWVYYGMHINGFTISCLFSVIGAYASIITRMGLLRSDAVAGRALHFYEVSSKLLAGGIFGVIAYALLHTPISPSLLHPLRDNIYGLIVIGFIAGFCEYFVPNLIKPYARGINEMPKNEK
jgi:hypothetical protein